MPNDAPLPFRFGQTKLWSAENPFFHPNQEDHRKFQTLGGVQGHQRHSLAVFITTTVNICHERYFF